MNAASRRLGALTCLAAFLAAAEPARGQSSTEADGLFKEGRAALARDEFKLAASYFDRSYQLEPTVGTLLNLALCKEKLGKLTAALADLEKARNSTAPGDRRLPLIEQRIAQLEARVPRLTVRRGASLDASVTILLDHRPLTSPELGVALRIDPGPHILDCAGPHAPLCSNVLSTSEADDVVVVVTSTTHPPLAPSAPQPASPPPLRTSGLLASAPHADDRSAAYVTAGVGIAGVVTGLIAGAGALRQKNLVDMHCDDRGCDPEGVNAARTGGTLATISTITTAVGLTTMGVSAYLFLKPPTGASSPASLSIAGSF